MVHRAGVKNQAVNTPSRQQTKGADETELDDEVAVLALSSKRFYRDVSTDMEELSRKGGADSDIEFTPYLPEVFDLADQISEEK